jgi:antitoxin component YwqK of YwqJK toxin-antitoxin module
LSKEVQFYPWGEKKSESFKKDGKFHGKYSSWHENGKKKSEVLYANGLRHGIFKSWHQTGEIKIEGQYTKGQKEGLFEYRNECGVKVKSLNYIQNALEGDWFEYYENSNLKASGVFKKNVENGVEKTWYENGQISAERHYREGRLMNISVWMPNGKPCTKSTIIDGNGVVVFYKKGVSREDFRIYYENGLVV